MKGIVILIFFLSILSGCKQTEVGNTPGKKIIVEIQFSNNLVNQTPENLILKDQMAIEYFHLTEPEFDPQYKLIKSKVVDGKVKWTFNSSDYVQVNFGFGKLNIVSPGDSIHINYNGNIINISGRGSDKLVAWERAIRTGEEMITPTRTSFTINSADDYLRWNQHIDHKLQLQLAILEDYQTHMLPFEYEFLKSNIVSTTEADRLNAFGGLFNFQSKHPEAGLSLGNLSAIWDSTQYKQWNQWLRSIPDFYGPIYDFYAFDRMEVWRKFNFDFTNDSLNSREIRASMYYSNVKRNYKGIVRERLLAYVLNEEAIREKKVKEATRLALLKDYYSQPDFPQYKQIVKALEQKAKN